jgi:uncharacterized damage-inducible protein DinB
MAARVQTACAPAFCFGRIAPSDATSDNVACRRLHGRVRESVEMSEPQDRSVLAALLDSWERNNAIMLNLLRALPEGGLEAKATESSPSVAQQFMHIHHERLVSVFEEAPEFARALPEEEWMIERDPGRIAQMTDSANAVRDAVRERVLAGRDLDLNYDHPILLLQLLLWHEGYHHGQIKLALKVAGRPISDDEAGPFTWDVWRVRTRGV